jgi:hypothetical protein
MSTTYKVTDLFGNMETRIATGKKKAKPNLFSDHDAFVEKFEPKKTTDDCYTPEGYYRIVLDYVASKCDLTGKEIVRPFYPGGDFEAIEYTREMVVIDNPPFSIITKIARYYLSNGVQFFLFAPHLTLMSAGLECTHIVCGADITYENGAQVKTSFLTNMMGEDRIVGDAEFAAAFRRYNEGKLVKLPKYVYPENVVTVSMVEWIVDRGISISVGMKETAHCRALDDQKNHGKTIFGSGFLLSDAAAAEKAAAEKDDVIVWKVSARERRIIDGLNEQSAS